MRKELGFSIDEWNALPWWQQRVYVEQMNLEAARASDDVVVIEEEEENESAASDADLRALGFNVE